MDSGAVETVMRNFAPDPERGSALISHDVVRAASEWMPPDFSAYSDGERLHDHACINYLKSTCIYRYCTSFQLR